MSRPVAYVHMGTSARRGRITIDAPDAAHAAEAHAAALAATAWATTATTGRGVVIARPPAERIGGAAEVEACRHAAQDARDAAKAVLRARGYTVRAQ